MFLITFVCIGLIKDPRFWWIVVVAKVLVPFIDFVHRPCRPFGSGNHQFSYFRARRKLAITRIIEYRGSDFDRGRHLRLRGPTLPHFVALFSSWATPRTLRRTQRHDEYWPGNELHVVVIINGFCTVCVSSVRVILYCIVRYRYECVLLCLVRFDRSEVKSNSCKYNDTKLNSLQAWFTRGTSFGTRSILDA